MSRKMSHEEIREDYIRRAEERYPGQGKEIGESYLFLSGKLLLMKHRFSEYKNMMRGDKVDRIILHRYLRSFFRDASNAFLDVVILEIYNFVDTKVDAKRGHLSLYSFMPYFNGQELENGINEVEEKANPIIRRRHAFVAHWGKAATIEGKAVPLYIDEIDCVIELIAAVMGYIGKELLGLNHFAEKSVSYDPWKLNVPGGVEHLIANLKLYEWLSHKYRAYMLNGEPFLSSSSLHIFSQDEKGEEERRKQRKRILALKET